jgi:hypothetical protein
MIKFPGRNFRGCKSSVAIVPTYVSELVELSVTERGIDIQRALDWAREYKFEWAGEYAPRSDGMHFERTPGSGDAGLDWVLGQLALTEYGASR